MADTTVHGERRDINAYGTSKVFFEGVPNDVVENPADGSFEVTLADLTVDIVWWNKW